MNNNRRVSEEKEIGDFVTFREAFENINREFPLNYSDDYIDTCVKVLGQIEELDVDISDFLLAPRRSSIIGEYYNVAPSMPIILSKGLDNDFKVIACALSKVAILLSGNQKEKLSELSKDLGISEGKLLDDLQTANHTLQAFMRYVIKPQQCLKHSLFLDLVGGPFFNSSFEDVPDELFYENVDRNSI